MPSKWNGIRQMLDAVWPRRTWGPCSSTRMFAGAGYKGALGTARARLRRAVSRLDWRLHVEEVPTAAWLISISRRPVVGLAIGGRQTIRALVGRLSIGSISHQLVEDIDNICQSTNCRFRPGHRWVNGCHPPVCRVISCQRSDDGRATTCEHASTGIGVTLVSLQRRIMMRCATH
jgi:hypothetical protein